jgi:type VI secretion system protein ImpK
MIPRPGGRPAEPAPTAQPAAPAYAAPAPAYAPPPAAAVAPPPQPLRLEGGLNPLVTAASTLLTVMTKLRNALEHPDVAGLHRQLVSELRQFEQQAKNAGVRSELAITARYLLCTALDETIMNTPWGAAAGWSQRSLLSLFHKETFGGEKFFTILGRLSETPAQNLDVLELVYLLLSLGFEGKYRIDPRGRDQLELIRDNLYRSIEQQRGDYPPDLSPRWQNAARRGGGPMHYVPLWVIGACALVVLLLCYSGFRFWLHQSVQGTAVQLQQALEPVAAAAPDQHSA